MTLRPYLPPVGARFGLFLPMGMQVVPGQSRTRKLPVSPVAHVCAALAGVGGVAGVDWQKPSFFPCKARQLHRNLAFGLGPAGLTFHHLCFLVMKERNECHVRSVSTSLIVLSRKAFQRHLYLQRDFINKKTYSIPVHEWSQGIIRYTVHGKPMNSEIKASTIWLHFALDYSLIHSCVQQLLNTHNVPETVLIY